MKQQQQKQQKPSKILMPEGTNFPSGAKSPIKKHLKHAAMANWSSSNPASPSAVSTQTPTTKATQHTQIPSTTPSGAKMATMRYVTVLLSVFCQVHHSLAISCSCCCVLCLCLSTSRASIIQVMLGLLDQEQATVEGTIPILQTLAALSLENPAVRQECLQTLQMLHEASFSPSKPRSQHQQRNSANHDPRFDASSDIPTSEGDGDEDVMPPSFVYEYDDNGPRSLSASYQRLQASDLVSDVPTFKKDSGRTKSLSLHHCKEFLLACANEIHELEDENPNFDYAEETSSETSRHHRRSRDHTHNDQNGSNTVTMMHMMTSRDGGSGKGKTGLLKWRSTEFDYVSTAPSSASVATELEVGFDDDLQADQGSEFSEVVRRADYLRDFDDDLEFEPERETAGAHGRHSMHQLNTLANNPREQLSLKHRVFSALKQNGLQSRRNASRKRLAFQNLKTNLHQMQLKRATMKKLRIATTSRVLRSPKAEAGSTASMMMNVPMDRNTRMKRLLSQQVDLVVVLLCAAFLHSMLS